MTMQNESYIFDKFSENLSKITTIKQLIKLSQSPEFDLEIKVTHKIPRLVTWNPTNDSFSGEYNLLVYPRIFIKGTTLTPPKMIASQSPLGMWDLERVFIEAVKQAVDDIDVWRILRRGGLS